jgi:hypothetical protein
VCKHLSTTVSRGLATSPVILRPTEVLSPTNAFVAKSTSRDVTVLYAEELDSAASEEVMFAARACIQ